MFVLTGVGLLAIRFDSSRIRYGASALTTLTAALVLAEYILGTGLGIDTLLFPATVRGLSSVVPGRPSPISAAVFLVLGLLLFPLSAVPTPPVRRLRLAMVLAAVVLPVLALAGHIFGVHELYAFAAEVATALHTALALLLLSLGVALATHEAEVTALLLDQDPGTILLRRLLPLAVLMPLLFTAGSVHALRLGLYQVHIGLSLYVALFIGLSLASAFWVAAIVRQADTERRAADLAHSELALRDRLLRAEAAAGAALKESERRTRQLLDVLGHAPISARGLDGRIRFWSAGAERLYGWTSKEAVGKRSHELLPTEWPMPASEAQAELLRQGEWHGELRRRARDGSRIQVATHWILHRDERGAPEAVIEVDRDVTGQKQAEEALKGSEARYRGLVAATAQIVWTASADGGRAIDMEQWEAFTGQSAAEAGRGGWLDAIHPEDRADAARAWSEALRERKMLAVEHRLRRRDGEYRQMEVRAVPVLNEDGRIREWVGAYTDITDRVRAEEELGQARKLQAVGTLAGGVAHEVNNQLMAVLGFGDFVLGALGPDHPQAPDVQVMIRSATRASQVAQQLLTFSRRQVNQTRPLDLHGAVTGLVPVLQRLLGADKTLVVLPNRARSNILADSTQIDQVLINLAANARDAMGTGGRLTFAVEEVMLDEVYARAHGVSHLVPGAHIRLTVSDSGCGMDRTTLAKIFEPFFTTKPVGAGTGLGLSTVYGIVKQHDGFIWAYSEPGLGTTMKIYLPATPAEAAGSAEATLEQSEEAMSPLERATVLVVEDEPAVRNLVRRSLEAAGLVVVEAQNGREALELCASRAERPRLVLTDVIMPELNGRELSEALAASQPGLPVLFMSGYTGEDVLARSLLPETAPFIQKPFAPEELVARVRTLLSDAPPPD
jgi:PAS domain S-box-containing protein